MFPSPSGVSHFSIYSFRAVWFCCSYCFRPLPGYLISQFRRSQNTTFHSVSVPFRGISFLNKNVPGLLKTVARVSVPFRGISFLNTMDEIYDVVQLIKVSVPFRGISFLNVGSVRFPNVAQGGFRPLPGYLISQLWRRILVLQ